MKKIRKMTPIILALITGLAALWAAYDQYLEKIEVDTEARNQKAQAEAAQESLKLEAQKTARATENLANVYKQLADANADNVRLSKELNKKSNEIIESNVKLIKAQEETLKHVFGEGFILVDDRTIKDHQLTFGFKSMSDYPVYDATITVFDYNKLKKCESKESGNLVSYKMNDYLNCTLISEKAINVSPRTLIEFVGYSIPTTPGIYYRLFKINSRNMITCQYSVIAVSNLNYSHYYKVFEWDGRTRDFKLLLESDPQLPESMWVQYFDFKKELSAVGDSIFPQ